MSLILGRPTVKLRAILWAGTVAVAAAFGCDPSGRERDDRLTDAGADARDGGGSGGSSGGAGGGGAGEGGCVGTDLMAGEAFCYFNGEGITIVGGLIGFRTDSPALSIGVVFSADAKAQDIVCETVAKYSEADGWRAIKSQCDAEAPVPSPLHAWVKLVDGGSGAGFDCDERNNHFVTRNCREPGFCAEPDAPCPLGLMCVADMCVPQFTGAFRQ